MDEKDLQNQAPAAAPAEEAAAEAAPAAAEPMQPMQAGGDENEPAAAAPAAPAEEVPAEAAPAEEAAAEAAPAEQAAAEKAGEEAAPAAAGGEEDPQEEKAEAEEQKEQEGAPQEADPKKPEEELASDDINQEIAAVAAEAGIEDEEQEEEGDPDRAFDTLGDLKKLNSENDSADGKGDDKDTTERVIQDRKAVMQLRKGDLYKAVIYARMLENGENPAGQAQELGQKPQSRFDRFLNASKLDKAGKVLKTANAASGLIGMASSGYKASRFSSGLSTANDIVILVNSLRGMWKKLKTFKQNSTSPRKKAFAVIALVSDISMVVAKGTALAQKIAQRRNTWLAAGVSAALGYISSFANMVGQVSALTGVCNTLAELATRHKTLKKAQKSQEAQVVGILAKYGMNEGAQQQNAQQEDAEQGKEDKEKAKKQPKKRRRLIRKNKFAPEKVSKEKVADLLERPDVSGEDKAVLAAYLARERMIRKSNLALANVSTGLITATLGLGATASKSIASNTKGKTMENATTSAAAFGAALNVNMLLSNVGMHIAGKKVNKPNEKENGLIRDGLYGALHELGGDDSYGLRKISATLTPDNPDKEHLQEAELAVRKYESASKQFAGVGVNYNKLFAANDIDTFKNSLVAGL